MKVRKGRDRKVTPTVWHPVESGCVHSWSLPHGGQGTLASHLTLHICHMVMITGLLSRLKGHAVLCMAQCLALGDSGSMSTCEPAVPAVVRWMVRRPCADRRGFPVRMALRTSHGRHHSSIGHPPAARRNGLRIHSVFSRQFLLHNCSGHTDAPVRHPWMDQSELGIRRLESECGSGR